MRSGGGLGAYSYTTITMQQGEPPRVSVTVLADRSVGVLCPAGRDRAQISIDHAGAHVLFAPQDARAPSAEDVEVARQLAEAFAVYADEVARLHAQADVPAGV